MPEYYSIIDVAIGRGATQFVNAEAGSTSGTSGIVGTEVAGTLRGDEQVLRDLVERDADRPVMQYKTALPKIYEDQIRQAV